MTSQLKHLAVLVTPLLLSSVLACGVDTSPLPSADPTLQNSTEALTSTTSAVLTGANEVPPVVTQATGTATFGVSSRSVSYSVTLHGLSARRIELRLGAVGTVGALVATLSNGGSDDGEHHGDHHGNHDCEHDGDGDDSDHHLQGAVGTLRASDLTGPFAHNWAGFIRALGAGQLYVNVTTNAHRTGELRGQVGSAVVTPGNLAPNGVITAPAANMTIQAGQSVSFAGTATDPDGNPVTVAWSFGDGSTSTALSPGTHLFAAAGTYVVTFTATDSLGLSDPTPDSRTITVQGIVANRAPSGTITAPASNVTVTVGQAVTFAGTATDPDGNPVTVLWNFGDGSSSTSLSPGAHTWGAVGSYTVTLTATDSLGLADPTPASVTITVQTVTTVNQAPVGVITAPTGNVSITAGQSVTFTGTATDPNGNPVTVLWNFGDGTTSTALSPPAHVFATAGTFTVRFTATDSLGLAVTTPPSRTITVAPVVAAAPTLTQLQTAIFNGCTGCHSAGGSAGLNLTAGASYSNLVNVAATTFSGSRVVPNSPGTSALVTQLAGGHRSVSAANQALIVAWINAGALNN